MPLNEYKPEFRLKIPRIMRNLDNVYIWEAPFVMSRTDARNRLHLFKDIPSTGSSLAPAIFAPCNAFSAN